MEKLNKQLSLFCRVHGYEFDPNGTDLDPNKSRITVGSTELMYIVKPNLVVRRFHLEEVELDKNMWSNFKKEYGKPQVHRFNTTKHLLRWIKKDIDSTLKREERKKLK